MSSKTVDDLARELEACARMLGKGVFAEGVRIVVDVSIGGSQLYVSADTRLGKFGENIGAVSALATLVEVNKCKVVEKIDAALGRLAERLGGQWPEMVAPRPLVDAPEVPTRELERPRASDSVKSFVDACKRAIPADELKRDLESYENAPSPMAQMLGIVTPTPLAPPKVEPPSEWQEWAEWLERRGDPAVAWRILRLIDAADLARHFACNIDEATRNARRQLECARDELVDARDEVARLEGLTARIEAALAECGEPSDG